MTRAAPRYCVAILAAAAIAAGLLSGCGGSSPYVYLNIRERPSWGANHRIAVAALGGDGNLYVWTVNETGGGSTLLTPAATTVGQPAGGTNPAYSPDSSLLAFSGRRAATTIIYTMSPDTGENGGLTAITEPDPSIAGPGGDSQPSWSPDGKTILYTSTRPDGIDRIWTVDLATKDRTELIDYSKVGSGAVGNVEWASYNPTGNGQIVFEEDASDGSSAHVYLREADGTIKLLVGTATDSFHDGGPSWSPDGSTVVFHSDRGGDYDIWAINADGTDMRRLTATSDSDAYPVYKPDGSRIAFIRGNELWTMNPDGSDQQQVTSVFQ